MKNIVSTISQNYLCKWEEWSERTSVQQIEIKLNKTNKSIFNWGVRWELFELLLLFRIAKTEFLCKMYYESNIQRLQYTHHQPQVVFACGYKKLHITGGRGTGTRTTRWQFSAYFCCSRWFSIENLRIYWLNIPNLPSVNVWDLWILWVDLNQCAVMQKWVANKVMMCLFLPQ